MTRSYPFVFAILLLAPLGFAEEVLKKAPLVPLQTTLDQASYAIGLNFGRNLKQDGLTVNSAAIVQGLLDALANAKPKLTDEQCMAALDALEKQVQKEMAAKDKTEGEKNKVEGQTFLAANAQKKGVTVLPSGLQYSVIQSGNGPKPTVNDVVRVHYHGTLINGKVFDSSVTGGMPTVSPVGQFIRGWIEALQLMRVGDKWKLVVPAELAYGPNRRSADIGPNSVLVFDVELLGIEPKQ